MSSPSKAERVRDVVAPAVSGAGLFLEDVAVHPAGKRTLVRVTVDLEADQDGALGLDAIADVARAVGDALEAADVIRGEHVLEVSSPGTDRPLTEPRHFARARGRLVTLTLTDGTQTGGRVVAADDGSVALEDGRSVPLTQIARGQVEVELNRLDDAQFDDTELDESELDDGEA